MILLISTALALAILAGIQSRTGASAKANEDLLYLLQHGRAAYQRKRTGEAVWNLVKQAAWGAVLYFVVMSAMQAHAGV
jgi:hypothetical protein